MCIFNTVIPDVSAFLSFLTNHYLVRKEAVLEDMAGWVGGNTRTAVDSEGLGSGMIHYRARQTRRHGGYENIAYERYRKLFSFFQSLNHKEHNADG